MPAAGRARQTDRPVEVKAVDEYCAGVKPVLPLSEPNAAAAPVAALELAIEGLPHWVQIHQSGGTYFHKHAPEIRAACSARIPSA